MFHTIPQPILARMRHLEAIDTRDRQDGTPLLQRLRQIQPETGKFLALMAASAPRGAWVEIGTSAGYSTLWLTLACREAGCRISTFEVMEEKVALARETFRLAQVEGMVNLVAGDARQHLADCRDVAFCFLDAEKEVYGRCYEALVPNMVPGETSNIPRTIEIAANAWSDQNLTRHYKVLRLNDSSSVQLA